MAKKEDISKIVLYAVALGMGVTCIVLTLLGDQNTINFMLGLGLASVGIAGLDTVA